MDRVQSWRVRGDLQRIAEVLEAAARSTRRVRHVQWEPSGEKLVATVRWDPFIGPQKITLKIETRTSTYCDVRVYSETMQLFDYGRNRRTLDRMREMVRCAGYELDSGAISRSWRRSTRP